MARQWLDNGSTMTHHSVIHHQSSPMSGLTLHHSRQHSRLLVVGKHRVHHHLGGGDDESFSSNAGDGLLRNAKKQRENTKKWTNRWSENWTKRWTKMDYMTDEKMTITMKIWIMIKKSWYNNSRQNDTCNLLLLLISWVRWSYLNSTHLRDGYSELLPDPRISPHGGHS